MKKFILNNFNLMLFNVHVGASQAHHGFNWSTRVRVWFMTLVFMEKRHVILRRVEDHVV